MLASPDIVRRHQLGVPWGGGGGDCGGGDCGGGGDGDRGGCDGGGG